MEARFKGFDDFILWELDGDDKIPLHYMTGRYCNAHEKQNRTSYKTAVRRARELGKGIGFVITADGPFFFVDLDNALDETGAIRPECQDIIDRFPGAFMERSQSGRGFHIIGSCDKTRIDPDHGCKARGNDTSFDAVFTRARFVALTGTEVSGDALCSLADELVGFIEDKGLNDDVAGAVRPEKWTTEPIRGGIESDTEVISRACDSRSTAAAFGHSVSFADIWMGNEEAMAQAWRNVRDNGPYDASRADRALAQHLAFWTGGNCEQIERIMRMCEPMWRPKWDERDDYLPRTIMGAVAQQKDFYERQMKSDGFTDLVAMVARVEDNAVADMAAREGSVGDHGGGEWNEWNDLYEDEEEGDGGDVTRNMGDDVTGNTLTIVPPPPSSLPASTEPSETCGGNPIPPPPDWDGEEEEDVKIEMPHAIMLEGSRDMSGREQKDYFKGCVYVMSVNRIMTPDGSLVKREAFSAYYGGYNFSLDGYRKTTTNAFTAFTESQVVAFPKVRDMIFDPSRPSHAIINGCINTYLKPDIESVEGDVGPFLRHMELLLPDESDRGIVLDYMAACVQRPGDKFQWCPMIQGCEGNGKSLIGLVLRNAVSRRYFHMQNPEDLGNQFNVWLERSIVVCVEEIFINRRYQVSNRMKAMITNDYMDIQQKKEDQRSAMNCAKFILFSNHKDGVHKHGDDRRYAVFYTAQQCRADKLRDGMTDQYFRELYRWAKSRRGKAALVWWLRHRRISTSMMGTAPETTSTQEALYESLGAEERILMEAVDRNAIGFRGGVIGSTYVDNELKMAGYNKINPRNRNKYLHNIGYVSLDRMSIKGERMQIYTREDHPISQLNADAIRDRFVEYNRLDV